MAVDGGELAPSPGQGVRVPDPRRLDRTVADLRALAGDGPVLRSAAIAAGISPGRLRAAVATGRLTALGRSAVVPTDAWAAGSDRDRHLLRVRAALLVVPDAVASHGSALVVHRLPHPSIDPSAWRPRQVELTRAESGGWRSGDHWVHADALPPGQREMVGGLPVTSLLRTAADVAVGVPLAQALIPLDAAARRHLLLRAAPRDFPSGADPGLPRSGTDPGVPRGGAGPVPPRSGADSRLPARWAVRDPALRSAVARDLADVARSLGARSGIRALRAALSVVDPAAESPLESISRGYLLASDLPRPEIGWPVQAEGRTFWADFAWPDLRVIGEADGGGKLDSREALRAEKAREDALRRAGWWIVRWTWAEVRCVPELMLHRVEAVLADAARSR